MCQNSVRVNIQAEAIGRNRGNFEPLRACAIFTERKTEVNERFKRSCPYPRPAEPSIFPQKIFGGATGEFIGVKMKNEEIIEPLERLEQFISEMQLLGEISEKILGAELSEYSPIESVHTATIEAIRHLSSIISTLSGEILQELKDGCN